MQKWTNLLIICATWLLILTFLGVVIHLATYIHHTLLLFALGILLAYALDPIVEWLRRTALNRSKRISSREFSVTAVVGCLLLILGLGIWSLEGSLVHQIGALQRDAPRYQTRALRLATNLDGNLTAHHIRFSLVQTIQHPPKELNALAGNVGRQVLPFLEHFATDIGESIIVLLIAIYYLLFSHDIRDRFNAMLPEDLRQRFVFWETDIDRIIGSFVRGQIIIALVIGALAAFGCLVLGIHLWLIIGLIVVVAALIPVFGPYLGALPAVIAALIGPTHLHNPVLSAVLILVYFVLINEVGSKVLYPKLVGEALGLHAMLVLFVLFAGLEIGGVIGVLFAAPLTAAVVVTVIHLYRYWLHYPDSLLSVSMAREEQEVAVERATEK